jgi:hypothetical protein
MVRGPMRCLCCGQEMSTTDLIGFRCDCEKDQWGHPTGCMDCSRCGKHCTCPEGFTREWSEVERRAAAGTLSHQRAAIVGVVVIPPTPTLVEQVAAAAEALVESITNFASYRSGKWQAGGTDNTLDTLSVLVIEWQKDRARQEREEADAARTDNEIAADEFMRATLT